MIDTWARLLDSITLRNRLILTAHETNVVSEMYQINALGFGEERGHAYLRPTPFERAKNDMVVTKEPVKGFTEEDKVDRYNTVMCILSVS